MVKYSRCAVEAQQPGLGIDYFLRSNSGRVFSISEFWLYFRLPINSTVTNLSTTSASLAFNEEQGPNCEAMDRLRQQYLLAAAESLLVSSPSTSAFLAMQRGQSTTNQHSIQATDSHRTGFCQSCGTMQIPGVTVRTKRAGPKGCTIRRQSVTHRRVAKSGQCQKCRKSTPMTFEQQRRGPRAPKAHGNQQLAMTRTTTTAIPALPTQKLDIVQTTQTQSHQEGKFSSKKRAKVRKDRAGLQALLGKSTTTPTNQTLSFADFLKK
jgi:RNase P subunit RPR2